MPIKNKVTLVYGPMCSGKSTKVQEEYNKANENRESVLVIKPKIDTSSEGVFSRATNKVIPADSISDGENLVDFLLGKGYSEANKLQKLIIDEASFFSGEFIEQIKEIINWEGCEKVVIAFLNLNYRGEFFPVSSELLDLSDTIKVELTARCDHEGCTAPATMTMREGGGDSLYVVKGAEGVRYGATCFAHHPNNYKK